MANKILAQNVYKTVCSALDSRNWNYQKLENDLVVSFGINGDDIPMEFIIMADAERQLIRLLSQIPFKMPGDKRMEGAIAVCMANNHLITGSFEYDLADGSIVFRISYPFHSSTVGEEAIHYLIDCACASVDAYNDQFLALSKGLLTIEKFIENEQNR